METIGFIGGTGPQGRGLALRLGQAGHPVLLGSRDAAKAAEAVDKVVAKADGLEVAGLTNDEVCSKADIVVVTVPYEAMVATMGPLAEAVGEKVLVSCVAPLGFDGGGPHPVPVEAGSAAQELAQLVPAARVVGAFQNVSATTLLKPDVPVDADVLLTGDDDDAREAVAALVERIAGMRPVHAGPLRLSRPIEEMTAVLISLNKRYGGHSTVKVGGV